MAVTTTLNAIDKVNLVDDERYDLPDVLAQMELVAEYIVRMLGGVFGGARKPGDSSTFTVSGALNYLKFNASVLATTTIDNKAMLLNFRSNAIGDDEGQVVWYDPSDPGQQTTIDLSGVVGVTPVYIWAKRYDIPDDADTRKKWLAGAETTFSLATRQRHRVEWSVDAGDHRVTTGDNQWFIAAEIEQWSGSIPTIRTWHPFDAGGPNSSGIEDSWTDVQLGLGAADAETLGVNQALRVILNRLSLHRKADGSVHPVTTDPDRGLDDLDSDLSVVETQLAAQQFVKRGLLRVVADGAGGWSDAGSSVNDSGFGTTLADNGWRLEADFNAQVLSYWIELAAPTVAGSPPVVSEYPKDIMHRSARDVASNARVHVWMNSFAHLEANSWSWTTVWPPTGFPPAGTILEVSALLGS